MRDTDDVLLITVPEAARLLGISSTKAWELSKKKDLPTIHIDRSVRVPVARLREWIAAKEEETHGPA